MNTTTNTTETISIHNLTFGIELETTGLSREASAAAIAAAIPGSHVGYNGRTVVLADGREWKAVSDGSISGWVNAEVVSPVCTTADMDMVQTVVRALRAAGAKVDDSTGIHIHVGVAHLKVRAIVNLIHLVARFEGIVGKSIEQLDRRASFYSKPTNPVLLASVRKVPSTMESLRTRWYAAAGTDGTSHYDSSRYHNLNLHSMFCSSPSHNHGTAEFRCFNGSLHAGKVRAYILLSLSMVARAANSKSITRREFVYSPAAAKHQMSGFLRDCRMVGDYFANPRKHLIETLPGTSNSYEAGRLMGTSRVRTAA